MPVSAAEEGQSRELDRELQGIYALSDAARHDEAELQARQLLERTRQRLGPADVATAQCLYCLGLVLKSKGSRADVADVWQQALAIRENHYGKQHAAVRQIAESLGELAFEAKDYPEARRWFERVLTSLNTGRSDDGQRRTRMDARLAWLRQREHTPASDASVRSATASAPRTGSSERWAVFPTAEPLESPLDGYEWHLVRDSLSLGLTLMGTQPCADPWDVEPAVLLKGLKRSELRKASADSVQRFATIAGTRRVLVPRVTGPDPSGQRFVLSTWSADLPETLTELSSGRLDADDPAASAAAALTACWAALEKLGCTFQPGQVGSFRFHARPSPPFTLMQELRTQARRLRPGPQDPRALAELALGFAMLGELLTNGAQVIGPRMLVRSSALAALAAKLAPQDAEVGLVRALSQIVSRHTAEAKATLQPFLKTGRDEAQRLMEVAAGDWQRLGDREHRWLWILALGRAGKLSVLAKDFDDLLTEQLPVAYYTCGLARELGLHGGLHLSAIWLSAEEDEYVGTRPPDRHPKCVPTWAPPLLRARARRIDQAAAAKPATTGEKPELGLTQARLTALRIELQALAVAEHAIVAQETWGVQEDAKAMLETARSLFPSSQVIPNTMAYLAPTDRMGTLKDWPRQLSSSDPDDPWGSDSRDQDEGSGRVQDESHVRASWELASPSLRFVRQSMSTLLRIPAAENQFGPMLDFELKVDPMDCSLWALRLAMAASRNPWPEVRQLTEKARKALPRSEIVAVTEAELLVDRGLIAAGEKVLEQLVATLPDPTTAMQMLVRLYLEGDRLGKAQGAIDRLQREGADALLISSNLCGVAGRLLDLGLVAEATSVVDKLLKQPTGRQDEFLLLGRFHIRAGRTEQGIAQFNESDNRYATKGAEGWRIVEALMEAGQGQLAADWAARTPPALMADGTYLLRVASAFGAHGDLARGRQYRRLSRDALTRQLGPRAKTVLDALAVPPELATTRDRALLDKWLTQAAAQNLAAPLIAIKANPNPAAVEALLQGVKMRRVGRQCALLLAYRAGLDIELPPATLDEDLEKAHVALSAWWNRVAPRYVESRLE